MQFCNWRIINSSCQGKDMRLNYRSDHDWMRKRIHFVYSPSVRQEYTNWIRHNWFVDLQADSRTTEHESLGNQGNRNQECCCPRIMTRMPPQMIYSCPSDHPSDSRVIIIIIMSMNHSGNNNKRMPLALSLSSSASNCESLPTFFSNHPFIIRRE